MTANYGKMTRERLPGNLKPGRPRGAHLNGWTCNFCGKFFDTELGWIGHVSNCRERNKYQYENREGFCLIIGGNYFRVKPQRTDCKRLLQKSLRALNQMKADTTTRVNMALAALVTLSCAGRLTYEVLSPEEATAAVWMTPVVNAETV